MAELREQFPYGRLANEQVDLPLSAVNRSINIPEYLDQNYWWAYLHPNGVRFFDQTPIVNTILLGNYRKLRDLAVAQFSLKDKKVLQVAAVYGDISKKLASALDDDATMDLMDVAPIQLQNVSKKLSAYPNVSLMHQDATAMNVEDAHYDAVLVFFLFHELPEEEKTKVAKETFRVLKPGGKMVVVDYHKPKSWSPYRYIMPPLLRKLEPFALSLWENDILDYFGSHTQKLNRVYQRTVGTGLYQINRFIKRA